MTLILADHNCEWSVRWIWRPMSSAAVYVMSCNIISTIQSLWHPLHVIAFYWLDSEDVSAALYHILGCRLQNRYRKLCVYQWYVSGCVYTKKRTGMRTEPCGTPQWRVEWFDVRLEVDTVWDWMIRHTISYMLKICSSWWRRMSRSTRSKAAVGSSRLKKQTLDCHREQ